MSPPGNVGRGHRSKEKARRERASAYAKEKAIKKAEEEENPNSITFEAYQKKFDALLAQGKNPKEATEMLKHHIIR